MKQVLVLFVSALLALTAVMATVPSGADLSSSDNGCYSDGAAIDDWGYASNDGNYGGVDESEFCLVWDVGCEDDADATVELMFPDAPQTIRVKHLDGLSNLDSFEVLVDGNVVGTYTDAQDSAEVWVESFFDVNVAPGAHKVTIMLTDQEWGMCDQWGQLAVDFIGVESYSEEVPEFGVLAAFGILALAGLFIARKRK